MSIEIKYEKIDSNNIKRWQKDLNNLNKQELQDLRSDYDFVSNMSDTILEKISIIGCSSPDNMKAAAQAKIDEIDDLLNIFNNTVTPEEIDFIDE